MSTAPGPTGKFTPPAARTDDRDFDAMPYSPEEQRVCDYLCALSDQIGCGEDPIGFLIASHNYLLRQRKEASERTERASEKRSSTP